MKNVLFILLILISFPARAENTNDKPTFPIPQEVSEIVTWTQLCGKWVEIESQNSGDRQWEMEDLISTTPALSWARSNCSYEHLESKIIDLQKKYENDPIVSYALYNLIGTYKD